MVLMLLIQMNFIRSELASRQHVLRFDVTSSKQLKNCLLQDSWPTQPCSWLMAAQS
jgi:hypothetical protein